MPGRARVAGFRVTVIRIMPGTLKTPAPSFEQVGLDQGAERVKHGSDVAAMDAGVLGDRGEHVALAAGLR